MDINRKLITQNLSHFWLWSVCRRYVCNLVEYPYYILGLLLKRLWVKNVKSITFYLYMTISGTIWTEKRLLPLPLGTTSLFCSALYMINWQFDPCSKYQIEKSKNHERKNREIVSKKAITLVRKNNVQVNSIFNFMSVHSVISVLSFAFCYWKLLGNPSSQPDKTVVGIAV
jgi:hypothetical protein